MPSTQQTSSMVIREMRRADAEDAAGVAALLNASDAEWPGGLTRGVPYTAARVLEEQRTQARLSVLVADAGEHAGAPEILGYGDLTARPGQKRVAYISFLNVRPDFHGRGIGRRLLLSLIETAAALGYAQVTLHTWGGNRKAVPLYKKCGFFWVPDTHVFMQNFLPLILAFPVTRPFFEQHSWYAALRRELSVAPDEMRHGEVPALPYVFEAGGQRLEIVVDRMAEGVTAVETDRFRLSVLAAGDEVPAGVPRPMFWETGNKTGAPLAVALTAWGEPDISVRLQETRTVTDVARWRADVAAAPFYAPRPEGEPSHRVYTAALVDGVPVSLVTSARAVPPVEVRAETRACAPGREEHVAVTLRNRLEAAVTGTLAVSPAPAVLLDRVRVPFAVPARSWTEVSLRVTPQTPGAHTLSLTPHLDRPGSDAGPLPARGTSVGLLAVPPGGGAVAWIDTEGQQSAYLADDALLVRVFLVGGRFEVTDRRTGRTLAGGGPPEVGPPFGDWSPGGQPLASATIAVDPVSGRPLLEIAMPQERWEGVTARLALTLSSGQVTLHPLLVNGSPDPLPAGTRARLPVRLEAPEGAIAAPLAMEGERAVLREQSGWWGSFPESEEDLPQNPQGWREGWLAREGEGLVAGLVWDNAAIARAELRAAGGALYFALPEAGPIHRLPPVRLVAGAGDWKVVAGAWRRHFAAPGQDAEEATPRLVRSLDAGLFPRPVLLTGAEGEAVLVVTNRSARPWSGDVRIEAPDGWSITEGDAAAEGCTVPAHGEETWAVRVVTAGGAQEPAAARARVRLRDAAYERVFDAPLVRLACPGAPPPQTRTEPGPDGSPCFVLHNGFWRFAVAPSFAGSLVSLRNRDPDAPQEIVTAYPEARPWLWMNLWFGGIHPYLGPFGDPRLLRERFTGEAVTVQGGARGLRWSGIRTSTDMAHKDWSWLRVETEYLTLGGANVLAIRQRLVNRTDARHEASAGVALYLAPGGHKAARLRGARDGQPFLRLPGGDLSEEPSTRWIAVEGDGAVFYVVAGGGAHVTALGAGAQGAFPAVERRHQIGPGGASETLLWLVRATAFEADTAYAALHELTELP